MIQLWLKIKDSSFPALAGSSALRIAGLWPRGFWPAAMIGATANAFGNLSRAGSAEVKRSRSSTPLKELAKLISPNEDARAYLQQAVLPVLGPTIEKLLHHVNETGELQQALARQAERDGKPKRSKERPNLEVATPASTSDAQGSPSAAHDKPPSPSADGTVEEEPEEEIFFDPLAWLSENLRQFAKGDTTQYREGIEARIAELRKQQEEEAAAGQPEEGAEEGAEFAMLQEFAAAASES
mmetsp:Transcript_3282/g.3657  ORF Transcript_3282/g.3657 Transcript_3282/m.3657 type:complete len:240 (+) Transcript_3282:3-722(+)